MNEKTILLTYKLHIKVAPWQLPVLLCTFLDYNKACNVLSQFAHQNKAFSRTRLGVCQYKHVRHDLGIPMSLARTAIRKVASVYANRKYRKREKPVSFSPYGAILYDRTGCTIRPGFVELKMSNGRKLSFPYSCSPKIPDGWEKNWTEARLVKRNGFCLEIKEKHAIGNIIHRVAKTIVTRAKDTNRAIAMERPRIQYKKSGHEDTVVRPRRNNGLWLFGRLGKYVAYKAALAGVPFVFCPPEYSSQMCPACGYASRDNRQPFKYFNCRVCGFSGASDKIAAINISRRGARILMAAGLSLPTYSAPGSAILL